MFAVSGGRAVDQRRAVSAAASRRWAWAISAAAAGYLGGDGEQSWRWQWAIFVVGGCHFAVRKIVTSLITAATGCMHGLEFADVHETGFILQPVMALHTPLVAAIRGEKCCKTTKCLYAK